MADAIGADAVTYTAMPSTQVSVLSTLMQAENIDEVDVWKFQLALLLVRLVL